MQRIKHITYILTIYLLTISCGKNTTNEVTTPDIVNSENKLQNTSLSSKIDNNIEEIISDLHKEIKLLKAELNYQNDGINKIQAQSQLWADPFSIYNKEIVLNNGSSIFGKITYQDENIMKVEILGFAQFST